MSEQQDYKKLSTIPIFRDLDKNELEIVFKHVFEQSVKKDNVLFVEGMPGISLYHHIGMRRDNQRDKK